MARIRTIKPEFWTDSLMVQLPYLTRLLYIALWTSADDYGFIKDEPERIAMELMPREPFVDVDDSIQLLLATGRLEWFIDEDRSSYYRVAHWESHQRVDHPAKSRIFRESSRKLAIPLEVRREVARKYGCPPGGSIAAECYYCGQDGLVHWWKLNDGRPSGWVVFPKLELDHLECEQESGGNSSDNIVLACRPCNRGKGTKHWFEFYCHRKSLGNPREDSRGLAPDMERKGSWKGSVKAHRANGARRADTYDSSFDRAWDVRPRRNGGDSKARAFRAWSTRLREGVTAQVMIDGMQRYRLWCEATGKMGTEFVLQAATFLGPDRHFEETWTVVKKSNGNDEKWKVGVYS